jgi:drug/metabolite transporter (DMT)-like permease
MIIFTSIILVITKKGPWENVKVGTFKLQFFRANIAAAFFLLYTLSLTLIPLGLAVIIVNLAPFWTALLAHCFNKEEISKLEIFAMAVCFSCVVGMTL